MLTTSFLGATLLSDFSQNVEAPTGQTANGALLTSEAPQTLVQ